MSIVKTQLVNAASWSLIQRVGTMLISFLSNMVLARYLSPDDFGCVGLILTFVSVADLFVDAGLGQSLVQKQNVDKNDISTVFTTNILLSTFFFTVIFICAPLLESYMNVSRLALYIRVEAVTIILRSLYVVHNAILNKQLNFKSLAKISISSSFISSAIAIFMAMCGLGVWSLIGKNFIMHLTSFILYRFAIKINVSLGIDRTSFKQLFSFGGFVSLSSLIDILYTNLASFIIGKRYTVAQLGYYTQAQNLKQVPVYSLSMVISQVLFPMFAKEQNDITRIKVYSQKIVTISTAFIFPVMLCLIVIAEPLIIFLYTSKWIPSVIYFRILCIAGLVNILIHINRSILLALGLSKSLFKVQVTSLLIGTIGMIVALQYNIFYFVGSIVLYSFINWLMVSIKTGQAIGYSVFNQIKDVSSSLLISLITSIISYIIMNRLNIQCVFISLVVNVIFFMAIYVLTHVILNTRAYRIIRSEFLR